MEQATTIPLCIVQAKHVMCTGSFEAGKMCCIDPSGCKASERCQQCGFQSIWSGGLRKELLDAEGDLKQGISPVWLKEVQWERFKTEKPAAGSTSTEKETLRSDRAGTIIDFLDEFEPVFNKYAYHRYILERTRESNLQFERSAMPGMLKLDVDWAENYTMMHAREIQSEYWMAKQCSIFVCIGKMLLLAAWSATTGNLKVGSEVTVELEGSTPFWATIETENGGFEETAAYDVRDGAGAPYTVHRSQLRARVWHTTAQIGVTNDKRHDSYATQAFMTKMIDKWEQFEGGFSSLHIHSDNAGSHFKNSRTLNYLSRLRDLLERKVTWSFGCPGHGKGPWDGIGGMMKRALRSATLKLQKIFKDYKQVAAYLFEKFEGGDWHDKHKVGSGFTINAVEVHQIPSSEIRKDKQEFEEYESIEGIRKSFGYLALPSSRVLQRWFDCWCTTCAAATGPGGGMKETSRQSGYIVTDCKRQVDEPWWDYSVRLKGTRGITAQKKIAQEKGREIAEKLTKLGPNTFVAVQDRSASREEHYIIGITVDCGDGGCILKQAQGKDREYIDGTRFDNGDYAVAVRWLTRLDEDPEQRTFELDPGSEIFTINSTELRWNNIELDRVLPAEPQVRRSSRGMTRAQSNQGIVLPSKYTIPVEAEQAILNDCW